VLSLAGPFGKAQPVAITARKGLNRRELMRAGDRPTGSYNEQMCQREAVSLALL